MEHATQENVGELSEALSYREASAKGLSGNSVKKVMGQMRAAVDRVMGEAGLYAPEHAAIALIQSEGDTTEASITLRAFRETLSREYYSDILDTEALQIERRISSAFREIPDGQILGPTRDYTQRLLDERLGHEDVEMAQREKEVLENVLTQSPDSHDHTHRYPRVSSLLKAQGLVKPVDENEDRSVTDVSKTPIRYPALRSAALQTLARSETGGLTAIGYSAMRGQGGDHPTIGELRVGWARISVRDKRGRNRCIGRIRVTESENISKIKVRKKDPVPYMSLGYGLCFGQNETKAICMGILDRSMRIPGDAAPAVSQEFALHHLEGPDSFGFASSLKLSEAVSMQSELVNLRAAIDRSRKKSAVKQKETEKELA